MFLLMIIVIVFDATAIRVFIHSISTIVICI